MSTCYEILYGGGQQLLDPGVIEERRGYREAYYALLEQKVEDANDVVVETAEPNLEILHI